MLILNNNLPDHKNWFQILRPACPIWDLSEEVELVHLGVCDSVAEHVARAQWEATHGTQRESHRGNEDVDVSGVLTNSDWKPVNFDTKEGVTYLPSYLEEFTNQEDEVEGAFWGAAVLTNPECPPDIDLQGIRAFLKNRQKKMMRDATAFDDVFDKYGLGMNARSSGGLSSGQPINESLKELIKIVDQMVVNRTKRPTKGKDLFDKRKPPKSVVGFRRDEMGGDKEYTELDDAEESAKSDRPIDFRKFWAEKGNFISNYSQYNDQKPTSPRRFGKGSRASSKSRKHLSFSSTSSQDSDNLHPNSLSSLNTSVRKGYGGKFKKGKGFQERRRKSVQGSRTSKLRRQKSSPMREVEQVNANERRNQKPKWYPEWNFPVCNYPMWVHRMYRMDQEKIGRLIKRGQEGAQNLKCVMGRVRGAKDEAARAPRLLKEVGLAGDQKRASRKKAAHKVVAEKFKHTHADEVGNGPENYLQHASPSYDIEEFLKGHEDGMGGTEIIDSLIEMQKKKLDALEDDLKYEIRGKVRKEHGGMKRQRTIRGKERGKSAPGGTDDRLKDGSDWGKHKRNSRGLGRRDKENRSDDVELLAGHRDKGKISPNALEKQLHSTGMKSRGFRGHQSSKARHTRSVSNARNRDKHSKIPSSRGISQAVHASGYKTCEKIKSRAADPIKDAECMNRFQQLLVGADDVEKENPSEFVEPPVNQMMLDTVLVISA